MRKKRWNTILTTSISQAQSLVSTNSTAASITRTPRSYSPAPDQPRTEASSSQGEIDATTLGKRVREPEDKGDKGQLRRSWTDLRDLSEDEHVATEAKQGEFHGRECHQE